jgi:acetyl esterase/lipase
MNNDRKMAMRSKFEPVDEALIQIPPADVSHVRRKWLDLPYAGRSSAQKLDVYLPSDGSGPFPIVLHIHGGAFAIGDKRDIHLLPFLADWNAATQWWCELSLMGRIFGRLAGHQGCHPLVEANAAQYHLDGNRIAACGLGRGYTPP